MIQNRMSYYHLRYNILQQSRPPLQMDEWICTPEGVGEQQLKDLLIAKHQGKISFTLCLQTLREDYELKRLLPPLAMGSQNQIDEDNLSAWNFDERSRISKKLSDDDNRFEERFRNTRKPEPLL